MHCCNLQAEIDKLNNKINLLKKQLKNYETYDKIQEELDYLMTEQINKQGW
jgi:chaperonin cofactor prefoldin